MNIMIVLLLLLVETIVVVVVILNKYCWWLPAAVAMYYYDDVVSLSPMGCIQVVLVPIVLDRTIGSGTTWIKHPWCFHHIIILCGETYFINNITIIIIVVINYSSCYAL